MTILRRDGWQDDPYKTIYGDLGKHGCKISFDQVRFKKDFKGWHIYGYITGDEGIVRTWQSDLPCDRALTRMLIHGTTYKTKVKNESGDYNFIDREPSKFEMRLFLWLNTNKDNLKLEQDYFSGSITFIPDHHSFYEHEQESKLKIEKFFVLVPIPNDGSIPDLHQQKNNRADGKGNSRSGLVDESRRVAIKKDLIKLLKNETVSQDISFFDLYLTLREQYSSTPGLLDSYLNLLGVIYK